MNDFKKYSYIISIIAAVLVVLTIAVNILIVGKPGAIVVLSILLILIIIGFLLWSTLTTYKTISDKKVGTGAMKFNFGIVKTVFPVITAIADVLGIDKAGIRRIFIKLNNRYIYTQKFNFDSDEILVLIPHCIQLHTCKYRVTSTIDNCKRCGECNIADLAQLRDNEGVKVFIATGGTLARKIIIDNRPRAVVAVACERDLTSGIKDIRKIPVLGVYNERPNGPCFDTRVNIKDVEAAVKFFKGKAKVQSI